MRRGRVSRESRAGWPLIWASEARWARRVAAGLLRVPRAWVTCLRMAAGESGERGVGSEERGPAGFDSVTDASLAGAAVCRPSGAWEVGAASQGSRPGQVADAAPRLGVVNLGSGGV